MAKYINAEPYKGMCIMKPITVAIEGAPNTKCGSYLVEQFAKIEYVDDIPTADVREVKHGKWEEVRVIRMNGQKPYTNIQHTCSLCKYLNKKGKGWNHKYCPNCGARMDGNGK